MLISVLLLLILGGSLMHHLNPELQRSVMAYSCASTSVVIYIVYQSEFSYSNPGPTGVSSVHLSLTSHSCEEAGRGFQTSSRNGVKH